MLADLRNQLQALFEEAIRHAYPSADISAINLETPSEKKHGEFSCSVALRLAGILKKNPMEIAGSLKEAVEQHAALKPALKEKIKCLEVKNPGFINVFLSASAFYDILYDILKKADQYGRLNMGQGIKLLIEFVSANPTGPLSVAHARQAAVGDALANIMQFAGFSAQKEFYVNDEGNQINILGQSIECRAREILGEKIEFPENCYQGEYIKDIAQEFLQKNRVHDLEKLKKIEPKVFCQFGVESLMAVIKKELDDFGVHFDVWSHQSKVASEDKVKDVLVLLEKKGFIYQSEGATWFKSTAFGDDKDRVVQKSDGSYTYLAPDVVYHKNKFDRGFEKLINFWGPDHHGYIPRIKAAVQALGKDAKAIEVLIVQLATIYKEGKPLSMSTRRGQYISLREVMEEVGIDAARFFFLMRHISAHLDFDLELAKKETPENPVYYIQYAYARICSVLEVARQSKLKPKMLHLNLLEEEEEIDLIKKIGFFPDSLEACVKQLDPFALVNYLIELAILLHKFYDKHRVVSENKELSCERLALLEATKIVLANGLKLLGIKAPQKM